MASAKTNYFVIAIGFAAILIMYWFAADPPSYWIFPIVGAGVLFSIGATIYKRRKGSLG